MINQLRRIAQLASLNKAHKPNKHVVWLHKDEEETREAVAHGEGAGLIMEEAIDCATRGGGIYQICMIKWS